MAVLEAKNLTLAYDQNVILKDLNLAVPAGKITALVGRNGCGKSTLLRTLARLLKPQGGAVYLNGEAIARMSTRDVAREMGILPQSPTAPEGLTVRELVAQGRYPHQSWLQQWSDEDERQAARALESTGMADLAERPLDALSGGQRQRAWIAMVLAQGTSVLLLDEPTTYLDLAYQIDVLDLLYRLNREEGRTVVMVLHDLNLACRYAHHLVAVKNGVVYAEGAPHQIITAKTVQDVFGIGCRIVPDPVTGTPLCIPLGHFQTHLSEAAD
ncbi:MAG TPA: ABC transporter ATP-binding protein [Symbiobacteriaceae bacterium]|nr:ABC transporter ATP-binding protein [Symbiobacteriaceae bacterium]